MDTSTLSPMLHAAMQDMDVMEALSNKSTHWIMEFMGQRPHHEQRNLMIGACIHFIGITTANAILEYRKHEGHDCAMADPIKYARDLLKTIENDLIASIRETAKAQKLDIPDVNANTMKEIMEEFGIEVDEQ